MKFGEVEYSPAFWQKHFLQVDAHDAIIKAVPNGEAKAGGSTSRQQMRAVVGAQLSEAALAAQTPQAVTKVLHNWRALNVTHFRDNALEHPFSAGPRGRRQKFVRTLVQQIADLKKYDAQLAAENAITLMRGAPRGHFQQVTQQRLSLEMGRMTGKVEEISFILSAVRRQASDFFLLSPQKFLKYFTPVLWHDFTYAIEAMHKLDRMLRSDVTLIKQRIDATQGLTVPSCEKKVDRDGNIAVADIFAHPPRTMRVAPGLPYDAVRAFYEQYARLLSDVLKQGVEPCLQEVAETRALLERVLDRHF